MYEMLEFRGFLIDFAKAQNAGARKSAVYARSRIFEFEISNGVDETGNWISAVETIS